MPHKTVEARFNCAFINATLIYGYRVAKGCFCFTFIYLYFSLFFSSSSDFFCKYLSIYFFPIFFWPPFAGLFVLIFSHAERAFCLILFGSQIAPDTNNIRPTTIRATPTKKSNAFTKLNFCFLSVCRCCCCWCGFLGYSWFNAYFWIFGWWSVIFWKSRQPDDNAHSWEVYSVSTVLFSLPKICIWFKYIDDLGAAFEKRRERSQNWKRNKIYEVLKFSTITNL